MPPAPPASLAARQREAWLRDEIERILAFALIGQDLQPFVDPDCTSRYVNARHAEYRVRPRDQIESCPVAELFGTDTFERSIRPRIDQALRGSEVHHQASVYLPGLDERSVEVGNLPAYSADGTVIGVATRARDVNFSGLPK